MVFGQGEIGPGGVGLLAGKGETFQETVQRVLAAVETVDPMVTSQLLDAETPHGPFSGCGGVVEEDRFLQQALQARMVSRWCIQRREERLPLGPIKPEAPPLDQGLPGPFQDALQNVLTRGALGRGRGPLQGALSGWRQPQIQLLRQGRGRCHGAQPITVATTCHARQTLS